MDVVFFVLVWVSSPSGGHSEFFGALAECERVRAEALVAHDTLYASECVHIALKLVKSVKQNYQRPSDIWQP